MSTIYHPSSVEAAINLLRSLGAPPRLIRHGEIVASVAGLLSDVIADLGVAHDAKQVEIGAALHDAGKIINLNELDGPGSKHEADGEKLLLKHGVSPQIARFCRTHGLVSDPTLMLEDHLVIAADHLWKGKRSNPIESSITNAVAGRLQIEVWEAFLFLDPFFEQIAAGADERLAKSRS
jgi:hypothetical protein